ncbi:ESX-1 secretion-associated protein [Mycolicibacterium pyrenivorans]|uniref:ESX-1 secretion-associated protein n=1 Tax=Mycolicibacterium pyrenivorans TaxID=187102 RepID=UPI0021F266D5|nr:ESX-1 secretion-associated protein [Mycolicibacterium pyrenivorans]MCV7152251.1 ESX-1 secretion-associated protein [Mycolicibacterium pyrenivorans]
MVEPLSVDTDGVRSLGDIHTAVSARLGVLTAGAPGPEGVAASHGTIAYGVDTALTAALGSRTGSLNVTRASGAHISELLHQAAMAYERGDQRGAEAIRAAADTIGKGQGPAAGGGAAGPAAPGSSAGGTDALGQSVGQLGQMGQQLGAPLAALAQPLQQLPQQIMQGVQQMSQSATQATESDRAPGRDSDSDPRPEPGRDQQPPTEAAPGAPAGSGPVPVAPGDRQKPAPTRPSSD